MNKSENEDLMKRLFYTLRLKSYWNARKVFNLETDVSPGDLIWTARLTHMTKKGPFIVVEKTSIPTAGLISLRCIDNEGKLFSVACDDLDDSIGHIYGYPFSEAEEYKTPFWVVLVKG